MSDDDGAKPETRKARAQELSGNLAMKHGPKFLAFGKHAEVKGEQYEPLLVRSKDKLAMLSYLNLAEEMASDVALLVDVLVEQGGLIAEQALEIRRLRAEVDAMRQERHAADVTAKMHEALLAADREVKGYKHKIYTQSSLEQETRIRESGGNDEGKGRDRDTSVGFELGSVLDKLKGASLKGRRADETVEHIRTRWLTRAQIRSAAAQEAKAELEIEHLYPSKRGDER